MLTRSTATRLRCRAHAACKTTGGFYLLHANLNTKGERTPGVALRHQHQLYLSSCRRLLHEMLTTILKKKFEGERLHVCHMGLLIYDSYAARSCHFSVEPPPPFAAETRFPASRGDTVTSKLHSVCWLSVRTHPTLCAASVWLRRCKQHSYNV